MVIGIVALFLCWVPVLGLVVGGISLLLALAGGFSRNGAGYAVAGFFISLVAIAPNALVLIGLISLESAARRAEQAPAGSDFLPFGEAADVSGIKVKLVRAEIEDHSLRVVISVENAAANRVVNFLPWSDRSRKGRFGLVRVALADNHGNVYLIEGPSGEQRTIRPGESTEDSIIFQPPIDNIEHLRLSLDCEAIDPFSRQWVKFKIPAEKIAK